MTSPVPTPGRAPSTGWGALASLLGAVLHGARDGDKKIQKRAAAISGAGTAIGLVAYTLQWGTGYLDRRADRDERRDLAVVQAVEKLATKIDADRDRVDALVAQSEAATRESRDTAREIREFIRLMAVREGLRPVAARRVTSEAVPR